MSRTKKKIILENYALGKKKFSVTIEHPLSKKIRGVKPDRGYMKMTYIIDPDKVTPEIVEIWDKLQNYIVRRAMKRIAPGAED